MRSLNKIGICSILVFVAFLIFYACKTNKTPSQTVVAASPAPQARVLVFIKTKGYYHESIPTGAGAIKLLGEQNNFAADSTSDASVFTDDNLKKYKVVVFLSTTMNVLNADQQVALERFIEAGGGFVGIHAATDTEYDWPWYNKLVGAQFDSHPKQQKATIRVTDHNHPSTSHLPDNWERFDEWYNFKNVQSDLNVLAWLDETTYDGGNMGDKHPFAWYHEFDGGRAFYTEGGHTKESYSDSLFLRHVLGGIKYAMGTKELDYSKSYSIKSPEDNRFTKTILSDDLNEPMELAVAPDGRVFFTERTGKLYVYLPDSNKTKLLRDFPVKGIEKYLNGLIGITLDPEFATNRQLYCFYSSATGEQLHQNVSRFTLTEKGDLDTTTEKIIIQIPIDPEVSAHTGGSLAWDKNNNLFISTGDNTTPFESDGYAPIDQRAGRLVFDAERSSGNTNDLRGKVLRIHPEPDGSYTVPEGNLFPKGTPHTRPEIYVMGCRNPYRISVDTATSILYWGEVGPDAGEDSRHGPRGYDEFNQARKPGNYGWPYFVGDSKAYNDSNFATKQIGPLFDAAGPVNKSPNNTGMQVLPPPIKAMIWYPYAAYPNFPLLGTGGRCAMGGPFYHFNEQVTTPGKIPAYYDKSLFVYDWMRNWVFAVRFDEQQNYKRMEPFMQSNGDFRRPVDLEIGPDGVMYMLEYGSVYGIDNTDARLVKITYNGGNRAPVARITATDSAGTAPYTIKLNGDESADDDDDAIQYSWTVNGKSFSASSKAEYTFQANGMYDVVLKVNDPAAASGTDTLKVVVGNTAPVVKINTTDNSSFFFERPTSFRYAVDVTDKEEKTVAGKEVKLKMNYIPKVAGSQKEIGHQVIDADYNLGKMLIAGSDCKACHQLDAKSVGPSFTQVSKKYFNDKNAPGYLANKVITGGNGVWGEHAMSAHPQLSKEEATEMVKYVLSLANEKKENILPNKDSIVLAEQTGDQGRYIFTASYTDKGNEVTPLSGKDILILRPSKVQVEDADKFYNIDEDGGALTDIRSGSYFMLKNIDLKDISSIHYEAKFPGNKGSLEVHAGSPKGAVVSNVDFNSSTQSAVTDPGGKNDLYFVFKGGDAGTALDWIKFEGGREVKMPVAKTVKKQAAVASKQATAKTAQPAGSSRGNQLIMANDCKTCHSLNTRIIGPSYMEIAERYKRQPDNISKLADKIISGGMGNWGDNIPMTPHPGLSKKDATIIVDYILSLKKK